MSDHIKGCELGENWKDCPACVDNWNETCEPGDELPTPEGELP